MAAAATSEPLTRPASGSNVLSPNRSRPGLAGLVSLEQAQELFAAFAVKIPLGRIGDPDEFCKAGVFQASFASSVVTGVELFADGGEAQV